MLRHFSSVILVPFKLVRDKFGKEESSFCFKSIKRSHENDNDYEGNAEKRLKLLSVPNEQWHGIIDGWKVTTESTIVNLQYIPFTKFNNLSTDQKSDIDCYHHLYNTTGDPPCVSILLEALPTDTNYKERLQYKLPVDGISCDNILIHIPNTIS